MKFVDEISDVRGNYPSIKDNFVFVGSLVELHSLPTGSGIYVFFSKIEKFLYPWRKSNIFYIGKADNLNSRVVDTHKKHTLAAMQDNRVGNSLYYPVYEYGSAFDAQCMYCLTENPLELEGELLARFATVNGAIPIANKKHDGFWYRFPEL